MNRLIGADFLYSTVYAKRHRLMVAVVPCALPGQLASAVHFLFCRFLMLNAIIRFSIRNKLIIGLFSLALVGWGGWSVTQLPIDAVPDITNNQVQVITSSPSLAAEDIERLVTFPIEVSLSNIPDITELRSFSRFGLLS